MSETLALTEEQEEDGLRPGQEVVTFKHVCGACGHLVALHRHDFWVEADYQVCEIYWDQILYYYNYILTKISILFSQTNVQ